MAAGKPLEKQRDKDNLSAMDHLLLDPYDTERRKDANATSKKEENWVPLR